MRLYLHVTGRGDLRGFWKLGPGELTEWAAACAGEGSRDGFEDIAMGEEVED
ncbi:MAG: hypothetical protein J6S60_09100 [Oscillospiraceae bacterium]|nr:hypothetical protein [Oscillospiraceae bacterium]